MESSFGAGRSWRFGWVAEDQLGIWIFSFIFCSGIVLCFFIYILYGYCRIIFLFIFWIGIVSLLCFKFSFYQFVFVFQLFRGIGVGCEEVRLMRLRGLAFVWDCCFFFLIKSGVMFFIQFVGKGVLDLSCRDIESVLIILEGVVVCLYVCFFFIKWLSVYIGN